MVGCVVQFVILNLLRKQIMANDVATANDQRAKQLEKEQLELIETLTREIADLREELEYRQKHGGRKKRVPGRIDDLTDYRPLVDGPLTICDECGHHYVQEKVRPWRRNDSWVELLLCVDLCLVEAEAGKPLTAYEKYYPDRKQV